MRKSHHQWNCFGYAIGVNEWFDIPNFNDYYFTNSNINYVLEQCVNWLLENYNFLEICNSPNDYNKKKEILIAFRIGIDYNTGWGDFHFMRYCRDNKWHTKNGQLSEKIYPYQEDIFSPWVRTYDDYTYNSEVIFFKYKKGSSKNAEPLFY